MSKDDNNNKESILLAWDEKGCIKIHFLVSKVPISQGRASIYSMTITTFSHSIMEVGSNFYGFHNMFSNDSEEACINYGYGGQAIKDSSFYSSQVHT